MADFDNAIYARDINAVRKQLKPKVDEEVSRIVGHKVLPRDPRLINLIIKWKQKQGNVESVNASATSPDNFFLNPQFITELKQTFVKPL